jgi:hypothetical protein
MVKRHTDGVRRVMVQLYLDMRIPLSAERSKMTNAQFVETLFKRASQAEFPDEMSVEELQAKYVEMDRSLRALGVTIGSKKEEMLQKQEAAKLHEEPDAQLLEKAVFVIADCMTCPERDRTKSPLELAEVRAEMLKNATEGRIALTAAELFTLAEAKQSAVLKQKQLEEKERAARLKVPPAPKPSE